MKVGAPTDVSGILVCFWSVCKIVANFPLFHAQIASVSVHAVRLCSGVCITAVNTRNCRLQLYRMYVSMVSCTTLYQVHRTSSSTILLRIDPQSTVRLRPLIPSFDGGLPTVTCSQSAMRLEPWHSPANKCLFKPDRERAKEREREGEGERRNVRYIGEIQAH